MKRGIWVCATLMSFWWGAGDPAFAQRIRQTVQLNEGWNTVFLEVSPSPSSADLVFGALPIKTVWSVLPDRLSGFGPDCSGPGDASCVPDPNHQWVVWVPPGIGTSAAVSLTTLTGGQVYFIEATADATLEVTGKPTGFRRRFRVGLNPVGFYVTDDLSTAPTFAEYLNPGDGTRNASVFRLAADGAIETVNGSSKIPSGQGYWVSSNADFFYDGPLEVDPATAGGVAFGRIQSEQRISLRNLGTTKRNVTVSHIASESTGLPPGFPIYAGPSPLYSLDFGQGANRDEILQWSPLTTTSLSVTPTAPSLPATDLKIGIRRSGLAEAIVDLDGMGSLYQSVLEIADDQGYRRRIGVTNEVISATTFGSTAASSASGTSIVPRPGLYVGTVSVDSVAWITAGAKVWTNQDPNAPEYAGLQRCNGGSNDGSSCFRDRSLCVGTPELEFNPILCTNDGDCPGGTCSVVSDCPGGTCTGFCVGGSSPDAPCFMSSDCPDGVSNNPGVCSADLDSQQLRPVANPFVFPVLVHLNSLDEYKLLSEVRILRANDDEIVLATPDCDPQLCDGLSGPEDVRGTRFARRISSMVYSFSSDLVLSGSFLSALSGTTPIAPDDPLNPFRHEFHPDHDCVDSFGNPVPGECFSVVRSFVFSFEASPPSGISVLDWGDSVLGGVYTEQVEGLHAEAIRAQGSFQLQRIVDIEELNTPINLTGAP